MSRHDGYMVPDPVKPLDNSYFVTDADYIATNLIPSGYSPADAKRYGTKDPRFSVEEYLKSMAGQKLSDKVDIYQGEENRGCLLYVDSDGFVTTIDPDTVFLKKALVSSPSKEIINFDEVDDKIGFTLGDGTFVPFRKAYGDAKEEEVLEDKTFSNELEEECTGTMRDRSKAKDGEVVFSGSYPANVVREDPKMQIKMQSDGVARLSFCPPKGYYNGGEMSGGEAYVSIPLDMLGDAKPSEVFVDKTCTTAHSPVGTSEYKVVGTFDPVMRPEDFTFIGYVQSSGRNGTFTQTITVPDSDKYYGFVLTCSRISANGGNANQNGVRISAIGSTASGTVRLGNSGYHDGETWIISEISDNTLSVTYYVNYSNIHETGRVDLYGFKKHD